MLPRTRTIVFGGVFKATWLTVAMLLLSTVLCADPLQSRIVCRENIRPSQREDLAKKLRRITGWSDLAFDRNGMLQLGNKHTTAGSPTARALLADAVSGTNFIVLEDASRRADVAFSRVIPGKWKAESPSAPPAFVVQIDFADFNYVMGDALALRAFDVGWALLHELDHVVNDSVDSNHLGEAGICESHINRMRAECALPQRADYFFTYLPLADHTFNTRLVRLGFEEHDVSMKDRRRYWLVWDAGLVGGINHESKTVALR